MDNLASNEILLAVDAANSLLREFIRIATKDTHCSLCMSKLDKSENIYRRIGSDNFRVCNKCCAKSHAAHMEAYGRTVLYLTWWKGDWYVTDVSSTLRLDAFYCSEGGHNIARIRRHFRFWGPDGKLWYGDQYGDYSQLAYCARYKNQPFGYQTHFYPSNYF